MTRQPEDLTGTLTNVSASWYQALDGTPSLLPVHVWLGISDAEPVQLHTASDGSIAILGDVVHGDVDLGEYGEIVVNDDSPGALATKVGQRINRVTGLRQDPPGCEVGFILHFESGAVAVANLGDDMVILGWPADAWVAWGVTEIATP